MSIRENSLLLRRLLPLLIVCCVPIGVVDAQNANGRFLAPWTKIVNGRGQPTAQCKSDPSMPSASSYVCGSSLSKVPPGLIQWTYKYCESADQSAGACGHVGLLLTKQRLAAYSPSPAIYTYYPSTDSSGCNDSNGACHIEGQLWKFSRGLVTVNYERYDLKSGDGIKSKVLRLRYANGLIREFTYGSNGQLETSTTRAYLDGIPDSHDEVSHFSYDKNDNLTKIINSDGSFFTFAYNNPNEPNKLTAIADSDGGELVIPTSSSLAKKLSSDSPDFYNRVALQWKRLFNVMSVVNASDDSSVSVSSLKYMLTQFRPISSPNNASN